MSNPAVILNGDQIYLEELVRENARLTVQHEADQQRMLALCDRVEQLEQEEGSAVKAMEACGRAQDLARIAEVKLRKAIADLYFVMAGGDPCKVCTVKCAFGESTCKPVWRGEKKGGNGGGDSQ